MIGDSSRSVCGTFLELTYRKIKIKGENLLFFIFLSHISA